MSELASSTLSAWQSFYVIVGSSGAALIGVQFVVITLIAGMRLRPTPDSLSAFATPTVVHLGGALLVSAVMSAPWRSLFPTSVALAMCGLGGFAYGRYPPRPSPNVLPAGVGGLALVRNIAV